MLVQEQQQKLGVVIARAWSDSTFKERLKAEPKTVLEEMGIEIPEGTEIEVVENTVEKTYLTLPLAPPREIVTDEDIITTVSPRGDIRASSYITFSSACTGCCSTLELQTTAV